MKRSSHFTDKALALAAERFNAMPPEQRRAMRPALEGYLKITRLSERADATELQKAMRRAMSNDPSKAREPPMIPWLMPVYSEAALHRDRPPAKMPAQEPQPEAPALEQAAPDTTAKSEAPQPETLQSEKAERREAKPLQPMHFAFKRDVAGEISRVEVSDDDGQIGAFSVRRGHDGRIAGLVELQEQPGMPA